MYHYIEDTLLADSNVDILETMFEELKKILTCWGLQIASERIQSADFIDYLG